MALKPTIHKFNISLSDLDREHYDSLNLTVAQHPSESAERMMARVLAYCINDQERLGFTRGLSETEEPDLWVKTLDDQIELWIDVGEPGLDRLKKATRQSRSVSVYSFNSKSETWWEQLQRQLRTSKLSVSVFRFDWQAIQMLADKLARTMTMSVTITQSSAYIATEAGECEVSWTQL